MASFANWNGAVRVLRPELLRVSDVMNLCGEVSAGLAVPSRAVEGDDAAGSRVRRKGDRDQRPGRTAGVQRRDLPARLQDYRDAVDYYRHCTLDIREGGAHDIQLKENEMLPGGV